MKILGKDQTGPAQYGSSGVKAFTKCPQLYAYNKFVWKEDKGESEGALALGSAMHFALAHHYLRVRERQLGNDPDTWYPAIQAVELGLLEGVLDPISPEQLQTVRDIYRMRFNPDQRGGGKVLYVEESLDLDMGELDMPGHPDHGKPILYNPRLDLVQDSPVEAPKGKDKMVWLTDHKTASSPSGKTINGYKIDRQFQLMHLIGTTYFGENFGGVFLNLIQTVPPYSIEKVPIPSSPFLQAREQRRYIEMFHYRARLELETLRGERSPFDWPNAEQETACIGRYGECAGYRLCWAGPASRAPRTFTRKAGVP